MKSIPDIDSDSEEELEVIPGSVPMLYELPAVSYTHLIGPFMSLEFIFILADIVNGCMALPNLIGLIGLRKEIIVETQAYFKKDKDSIILEEFVCE